MDITAYERTWVEGLNRGDVSAADQCVRARLRYPHQRQPRTKPQLEADSRRWFGACSSAFPDLRFTIEDQIVAGDKVATRWTAEGTNSGAFGTVPATGRHMQISGLILDRVVDGKVVERWEQWDQMACYSSSAWRKPDALSHGNSSRARSATSMAYRHAGMAPGHVPRTNTPSRISAPVRNRRASSESVQRHRSTGLPTPGAFQRSALRLDSGGRCSQLTGAMHFVRCGFDVPFSPWFVSFPHGVARYVHVLILGATRFCLCEFRRARREADEESIC